VIEKIDVTVQDHEGGVHDLRPAHPAVGDCQRSSIVNLHDYALLNNAIIPRQGRARLLTCHHVLTHPDDDGRPGS
jgi:hypothetical protein